MISSTALHTLTTWVNALPPDNEHPDNKDIRQALHAFVASLGCASPAARTLPRAHFLELAGLRLQEDYDKLRPLVAAAKQLEQHSAAIAAYVLEFNE